MVEPYVSCCSARSGIWFLEPLGPRPFSKRMLRVETMVDYFVMVLYTFCWVFVPTGKSIGSDKLNKAREKLGPGGSHGCGTSAITA
jgi:hypothetical protein